MDCIKCGGQMAEGFVVDQGYGSASVSKFQSGRPRKSIWTGVKQSKEEQAEISTYRCGRCGYLESYANR